MTWTPKGYIHVREWLDEEVRRRGEELNNASWSRAFDDLAGFLADQDDPEESQSALFMFESGRTPHPIPLFEWRKRPDQRGELSRRRVYRNYNVMGSGSGEFGFVAIRLDLRLTDTIPTVTDAKPALPAPPSLVDTRKITPNVLAEFLTDLNKQYEGQTKPTLEEIADKGRTKFEGKWRKGLENKKNAEGPDGRPLYPNLHNTKSGPRGPRSK
jgi:hypothetical protein